MRQLYLLDNSVTQRVHRAPTVAQAVVGLLATGELASCLPQILEECYSARSAADHRTILDADRRAKVYLPPDEEVARIAVELQGLLFGAGMGRAVGVSDLQIAATALRHSHEDQVVTIVHYDADFDHAQQVRPDLSAQWIVPRGTIQ
ncbi:PIN domain-containing protein [Nocardioides sp. SLBN-35]|uniref:PIN domain-containing protein n=1 Tax=Nocardioides sp. SLBN-35 TaxID=2768445 RepID=UPI00114FA900|nr:PIN domain-containing protein [Nocardioides sp. SLBN-35]TQK72331.1 putative nucleic acid-binding protein [Nocardioides sp. SLBN-35]